MKTLFKKITCENCKTTFDCALRECPKCHHAHREVDFEKVNEKLFWIDPLKQISLFLLVVLGFQLLGIVFSLIFFSEDKTFTNIMANTFAYSLIFIAIFFIVFPHKKSLIKQFKNYKDFLFGLMWLLALLMASFACSMFAQSIFTICYPDYIIDSNANQQAIVSITKSYPVLAFLVFGIIGPIVEEFGYRVGLFNFLKRFNNWIAYIVSGIIFGFIHFDYFAPSGPLLAYEFLIIPSYIFAGIILAVAYERNGLAGSITAHILNNILGLMLSLIQF